MNILIRPTEYKDAEGLTHLYSQPKAQARNASAPFPIYHNVARAAKKHARWCLQFCRRTGWKNCW